MPASRHRRSLLALLSTALLGACSATGTLNATTPADSERTDRDIAYGPAPHQRLDVYRPATVRGPVVVFFHGGTWTDGDRSQYRFVAEALAAAGAVVVLPDIGQAPAVRYPAFVQDAARAVRWAYDQADELGSSADRIVLMGHSSGAYDAAMLALDARWLNAVGLRPQQLRGWIGLAGPYDFLPIDNPKAQVAFNWPNTPADSQPLAHAGRGAPRTFLGVADSDTTVRSERNSLQLAERLRAAGVDVTLKRYDRVNHVTIVGAFARPLRWLAPVREDVLAFLGLPTG